MTRKYVLLIAVMAFLAVMVHLVGYDTSVTEGEGIETVQNIPLHMGEWTGTDQKLDPLVYDILETRAILHRLYRNTNGAEVFLSLVYYVETKVDFHAPEACLGGQGVKTEKTPAVVRIITSSGDVLPLKVNRLVQKEDNGIPTLVYYFYKTGSFVGRNYIRLRMNLVLNKFMGARKSGCLIRVSTPVSGVDKTEAAQRNLEKFINDLFPHMMEFL